MHYNRHYSYCNIDIIYCRLPDCLEVLLVRRMHEDKSLLTSDHAIDVVLCKLPNATAQHEPMPQPMPMTLHDDQMPTKNETRFPKKLAQTSAI